MRAVVGGIELSLIVGLTGWIGHQLERRWYAATGALGVVAKAVLSLAVLILVCEALGTMRVLRPVPIILALAVLALLLRAAPVSRLKSPGSIGREETKRLAAEGSAVALVAAPFVLAWLRLTWTSIRMGMSGVDNLGDHLPRAARFAQTAATFPLHIANPLVFLQWHPGSNELLIAVTMATVASDAAVSLLNLLWLALLLLAGWSFAGVLGSTATLIVGLSPLLLTTSAGTAKNDLAVAALVLASAALLMHDHQDPRKTSVAGVAAGLALGVKITAIGLVGLLSLAVVSTPPGPRGRWRRDVAWIGAVGLTGGYWYIRNAWYSGSPLPTLPIGVGPLRLPTVEYEVIELGGFSVLDFASDAEFWRQVFLPAIDAALGPLWPLLLGLSLAGSTAAVLSRRPLARRLGLVALAAHLVYLITPGTALGTEQGFPPVFYVFAGLRYDSPGIVLGLVLLAWSMGERRGRRIVLVAMLAMTAVGGSAALEKSSAGGYGSVKAWLAFAVLGGIVVAAAWLTPRRPFLVASVALGAVLGISVMLSALPAGPRYDSGSNQEAVAAWRWAKTISGARIVTAGRGSAFPLTGVGLENEVLRAVERADGGDDIVITSCPRWVNRIRELGATHVVTAPVGFGDTSEPLEAEWLSSSSWARQIVEEPPVRVFEVTGIPDPNSCR